MNTNALTDERHQLTNVRPRPTTTPEAYGVHQGARPVPLQLAYVACEYTQTTTATDTNTGMPTTTNTRCTNPAQLAPGYQRACTDHTFHVLLATLNQYLLSRESIPTNQRTDRWMIDVENATNQRDTLTLLLAGAVPTLPTAPKPKRVATSKKTATP